MATPDFNFSSSQQDYSPVLGGTGQTGWISNPFTANSPYKVPELSFGGGTDTSAVVAPAASTNGSPGMFSGLNFNWLGGNGGGTPSPAVADVGKNWKNMSTMGKVGAVGGLAMDAMGAWNAMQQASLAKKQFKFQKDAFNKQWSAETKRYNSSAEARQDQRVARDPNAMATKDYMAKYGI